MSSVDLIAFDLDGTVFGVPFKQEITDRVYQAFAAAHERGVTIAVATGRPRAMLGAQISAAPWLDWGITVNGASIVDMRDENRSLVRPIPQSLALGLIRELGDTVSWTGFIDDAPLIEEKKVLHMAEFGLGAFSKKGPMVAGTAAEGAEADEDAAALEANDVADGAGEDTVADGEQSVMERFGFNPIEAFASQGQMQVVSSIAEYIEGLPADACVQKLGCAFDTAADTDAAFDELTHVHKDLEIAILNPTELEITCAGVSKGTALELLCWRLNIDPARAVAFGDSGNDISMTGRANRFVAMGNADSKIKLRADEVCDTVTNDGVAKWIEENVL